MPKSLVKAGAMLRDCRSGVAYIEFAYSLPVLMMLGLTGVELANIALVNARVSAITSMVADGVARVRDRIDEADINEMVLGANMSGQGLNLTTNGRIIISTVEDNAATAGNTTDQVITWQRCKGVKVPTGAEIYGSEGSVLANPIGPTGRTIAATPGNPVIFVQIIYEYQPIMTNKFFGVTRLHYASAMSVRDRVVQTMQNGGGLANSAKALCSAYTA